MHDDGHGGDEGKTNGLCKQIGFANTTTRTNYANSIGSSADEYILVINNTAVPLPRACYQVLTAARRL